MITYVKTSYIQHIYQIHCKDWCLEMQKWKDRAQEADHDRAWQGDKHPEIWSRPWPTEEEPWSAPTSSVTPVIRPCHLGHARDRGCDGHCTHISSSSRPWQLRTSGALLLPLFITTVVAHSRHPSPITPVIIKEKEEEHSTTPVTMKNWVCSSHHGSSSRPWPT